MLAYALYLWVHWPNYNNWLLQKVQSIKEHVENKESIFKLNSIILLKRRKEEFHTENPDTTEDFHYHSLKVKFDESYSKYRDNKMHI
jgi:hypothetical protein